MAITQNGRLAIDDNDKPVMGGTSSVDDTSIINSAFDPTTRRLLVNIGGGGSGTPVLNEVVAGSGTSWTLTNTPTVAGIALYANGQRLTPTVDYSLTGIAIITVLSWGTGTLLADYYTS